MVGCDEEVREAFFFFDGKDEGWWMFLWFMVLRRKGKKVGLDPDPGFFLSFLFEGIDVRLRRLLTS